MFPAQDGLESGESDDSPIVWRRGTLFAYPTFCPVLILMSASFGRQLFHKADSPAPIRGFERIAAW